MKAKEDSDRKFDMTNGSLGAPLYLWMAVGATLGMCSMAMATTLSSVVPSARLSAWRVPCGDG